MARAATTSDVFNAIAEPQRREILVLLRAGERPVTEMAQELGMTQPGASKHLRVLREVGLVRDRKAGNLIDEFSIALSPVLFGSGIHLFEGVDAGRVALEPVRAEPTQRVTHLTCAVHPR
jgi:DNA-binding transcriptional ArsR family regulator